MAEIVVEGLSHVLQQKAVQVATDLFMRIQSKTPVETGRARASWRLAAGQADESVAPAGSGAYGLSPVPVLNQSKPGENLIISNNLPYIRALEFGSASQDPAAMVRIAVQEVVNKFGG